MTAVRTETRDGLEFEIPTWDRASQSWAEDPELTERLGKAIRAAVPNHDELVRGALARSEVERVTPCPTYWGSHGCDLDAGHDGLCVCTVDPDGGAPCSAILKYGASDTAILWWGDEELGLRLSTHRWWWSR